MAIDVESPDGERQSELVVFADESGDHGLTNLRSHSRAFVIAYAIFGRQEYDELVVPAFKAYKQRFFGDELVPLHERDIRRGDGAFRRLAGPEARAEAEQELRRLLAQLPFSIVAVGVRKDRFVARADRPASPYDLWFVEGILTYLSAMPSAGAASPPTEIVVDSRGEKEDGQLQNLVNSLTHADTPEGSSFPFQIRFAKKTDVEVGVEVADLIANPIARHVLNEEHPMIPFRLLEPKFLKRTDDPSRPALIVLERG